MGKDSLIKSTAKKSATEKEKEKPKKKSAKKAAPKSAAPKKAAAKPAAKKQTKATKNAKTTKATKSAKATKSTKKAPKAVKKPAKKPTLKELLHKKFEGQKPPVSDKPMKPDFSGMTAPLFINTDDPAEAEHLKTLLSKKFDMAEIKASAKPPEARKVEIKETPPASAEPESVAEAEAPAVEVKEPEKEIFAEEPAPAPEPEPDSPPVEPAEEKSEPTSAAETEKAEAPPKAEPKPVAASTVQDEAAPVEIVSEPEKEPTDPVLRAAKIAVIVVAVVVLMIVWASFKNSAKYFITSRGAAVVIEKGNFSPTGKRLFVVLHGFQLADEPTEETYRRNEIFPIIFGYYLNKADTLLEVAGLPDYKAINDDLEKAEQYALTSEMRNAVQKRTSYIQRMTLLYKAEVDASKNDIESLESALKRLKQVKSLTNDPAQLEVITQRIATVTAGLEAAKTEAAEKTAAAERAEETTEETSPDKQVKE